MPRAKPNTTWKGHWSPGPYRILSPDAQEDLVDILNLEEVNPTRKTTAIKAIECSLAGLCGLSELWDRKPRPESRRVELVSLQKGLKLSLNTLKNLNAASMQSLMQAKTEGLDCTTLEWREGAESGNNLTTFRLKLIADMEHLLEFTEQAINNLNKQSGRHGNIKDGRNLGLQLLKEKFDEYYCETPEGDKDSSLLDYFSILFQSLNESGLTDDTFPTGPPYKINKFLRSAI